jgi:hypothetical protein
MKPWVVTGRAAKGETPRVWRFARRHDADVHAATLRATGWLDVKLLWEG